MDSVAAVKPKRISRAAAKSRIVFDDIVHNAVREEPVPNDAFMMVQHTPTVEEQTVTVHSAEERCHSTSNSSQRSRSPSSSSASEDAASSKSEDEEAEHAPPSKVAHIGGGGKPAAFVSNAAAVRKRPHRALGVGAKRLPRTFVIGGDDPVLFCVTVDDVDPLRDAYYNAFQLIRVRFAENHKLRHLSEYLHEHMLSRNMVPLCSETILACGGKRPVPEFFKRTKSYLTKQVPHVLRSHVDEHHRVGESILFVDPLHLRDVMRLACTDTFFMYTYLHSNVSLALTLLISSLTASG